MYLFTRSTQAALGRQFEALPAAVAIASKVTEVTGHQVSVFTARFGRPLGSVMWSVRLESHAELQALTDKLLLDNGYLEQVRSMDGLFMSAPEDRFGRVLTEPLNANASRFYGVTQAAMTAGKYAEGIQFGIKVAQYMGTALDAQTAFVKPVYGGFADVAWLVGFDSMEAADALDDWQMSDTGYREMVTEAAGLFVENSGHTSMIEKLN